MCGNLVAIQSVSGTAQTVALTLALTLAVTQADNDSRTAILTSYRDRAIGNRVVGSRTSSNEFMDRGLRDIGRGPECHG